MRGNGAIKITTMCIGRICIGYRSVSKYIGEPDYVAVLTVFISVFVVVWAALVIILVLSEICSPVSQHVSPLSQNQHLAQQTGERLVKEILRRRALVQDLCPIEVGQGHKLSDFCAICLDHVENGHLFRRLLCNHVFHAECIDRWLLQSSDGTFSGSPECPICKTRIQSSTNPDYTENPEFCEHDNTSITFSAHRRDEENV